MEIGEKGKQGNLEKSNWKRVNQEKGIGKKVKFGKKYVKFKNLNTL